MRFKITLCLALVSWFAVISQYILMLENRSTSVFETNIRFFSFFTLLSNLLVAIYFTAQVSKKGSAFVFSQKPGVLSALTVYIFIVGLVYQILLRGLWHPTGLQRVADELLHSVIPLEVMLYWYYIEAKSKLNYTMIGTWLLYPLFYLVWILSRGNFSGFYPYPFMNVASLGMTQVLLNSCGLTLLFLVCSWLIIFIGKKIAHKQGRFTSKL
jgi:hypothetical protein